MKGCQNDLHIPPFQLSYYYKRVNFFKTHTHKSTLTLIYNHICISSWTPDKYGFGKFNENGKQS